MSANDSKQEAAGCNFTADASDALRQLRASLAELLPAIPKGVRRATDLQKALKLDGTLSWQVFKLAESSDPMSAASFVPGAASMKRFFDAAKRQVPGSLVSPVAEAFERFENMVAVHAGDRNAFNSMVSGVTAEGSEQVDLKHKRNAFRASAHFWGLQAACGFSCSVFGPNAADASLMDMASLRGRIGLWRARPGPPVALSRIELTGQHNSYQSTFTREPLDPDTAQTHGVSLIRKFCSEPLPEIVSTQIPPNSILTELLTPAVGRTAALTCVLGDVARGLPGPTDDERFLSVRYNVRIPSEVVLHDVLVHDSFLGRAEASVAVYSDLHIGDRPPVKRHPSDQIYVNESVAYLGRTTDALFTANAPRYVELVRWGLERLGWKESEFHFYRCRAEYPILATTLQILLEPTA